MKYDELKTGIQEIVGIAQSVPQEFQQRCFELLLNALLKQLSTTAQTTNNELASNSTDDGDEEPRHPNGAIPKTTQLRVLMRRSGITDDQLNAIVDVANDEVHWLKEPSHGKVSTGQAEWSLLLALRSAILNKVPAVDPEEVRSICQEKGYYDKANFASNFKTDKVKAYFKGPMVAQGDPQALTSIGEKALASLVLRLSGTDG